MRADHCGELLILSRRVILHEISLRPPPPSPSQIPGAGTPPTSRLIDWSECSGSRGCLRLGTAASGARHRMDRMAGVVTFLGVLAGALASVQVSVPGQVEVEVMNSVTIPCTHTITGTHSNIMVEWFVIHRDGERQRIAYQEGSSRAVDPGTDYTSRVSVDPDSSLTLSDVRLLDERPFLCQVTAGAAGSHEGKAQLKVYDAPEPPEVSSNPAVLSVTEQHPSEIGSCTSRNGYPSPYIVWFKDGSLLPTVTSHNDHMYMTPRMVKEASGLFTVTSHLFLRLAKKDKDSEFRCQVRYRTVSGEEKELDSETFTISLHYHTEHVTFNLATKGDIKEGDEVRMRCTADGFPQPEYIFSKILGEEEQELETSKDGLLVLKDVSKNASGTYRCDALDFDAPPDVVLKKDVSIFVHYLSPPQLTAKGPVTVQLGDDLEVSCSSQASDSPKIIWRKGKDHLSHSGTLSLKKVGYKSSGTYVCEASVPSVRGLVRTRQLKVLVEGKPSLETGRWSEVTVAREGERVTLTCSASGHPSPKISWSIEKQPVVSSSDQVVVSKVSLPVTPRLAQTGIACNASNKHGWNQSIFRIAIVPPTTETPVTSGKPELVGGGGMVVIAVVVCVLLLLLVVTLLYCLHKRGRLRCGNSEKKDTVHTEVRNDDIVVEMKTGQSPETSGLLGVNTEKRPGPDRR